MTTERKKLAIKLGITANVGRTVKAQERNAFRYGETAKIIGWGFEPKSNNPLYVVQYEDGECGFIFAGKLFEGSGFVFV